MGKGAGRKAFRHAGRNSGSLRHKVSGNIRLTMKNEGCAALAMKPRLARLDACRKGSGKYRFATWALPIMRVRGHATAYRAIARTDTEGHYLR